MAINDAFIKKWLRILLGILFIVAAISKCCGPENFLKEVGKLSFLSPSHDAAIAFGFVAFEMVLGLLIIFKCNNRVLWLTGITVFVLSCYLGYKVLTHDVSDCGCFGNFLYRSNISALVQDLFILIIVVYVYD